MKTLDVNAKEWRDKVNGNSYFSAVIIMDYGTDKEKTIPLPRQCGYGESYLTEAKAVLTEHNYIDPAHMQPLTQYCRENGIILRKSKQENCRKKDLTTMFENDTVTRGIK